MLRNQKVVAKPTGATRTYTVAKDGFIMNTFRKAGDKLSLHPRQAIYLIHAGQLVNPDKKASVAEQAKAAFAAAAKKGA